MYEYMYYIHTCSTVAVVVRNANNIDDNANDDDGLL